jgi:23S rRNA U2552 (ribose-2'-O)-methylase RlmE/FtsJ
MDKCALLCLLKSKKINEIYRREIIPYRNSLSYVININNDLRQKINYDEELDQKIDKITLSKDEKKFIREQCNPFEKIGSSIFMDRASVKLANLDFLFDLIGYENNFTFCDVCAGPGGFTQYIQYKNKNAIGFGMTLKNPNGSNLNWNYDLLDMDRFHITYGTHNGDIMKSHFEFRDFILPLLPEKKGVDFFVGDGGFDYKTGDEASKEFGFKLFFYQCMTSVMCVREGGNVCIKMFNSKATIIQHFLYLMSLCFDELILVKPVSSRPSNSEKYLVCKGRKQDIKNEMKIFEMCDQIYRKNDFLNSIFEDMGDFNSYMLYNNNLFMTLIYNTVLDMYNYFHGKINDIEHIYNIPKFFQLWKVPFNVITIQPHEEDNKIKNPYTIYMDKINAKIKSYCDENTLLFYDIEKLQNHEIEKFFKSCNKKKIILSFLDGSILDEELSNGKIQSNFYSLKKFENFYTKKILDSDDIGFFIYPDVVEELAHGYKLIEKKNYSEISVGKDLDFNYIYKKLAYCNIMMIFEKL